MTPLMLRQLWSIIEAAHTHTLLRMDDDTLVQWLSRQFNTEAALNADEASILNEYIQSRLTLIRDLAQERQAVWQNGQ
jgi:hypothetical protein